MNRKMLKIKRVEELYKFCRDNNLAMLSNFNADFWEVYRNNSDYFDRLFYHSYKSFSIFTLRDAESEEELCVDWIFDVVAFLKANEKRYSELWRMQTVSDTDYSMLDNYNVRETHNTATDATNTDTIGSRTDTKSSTLTYGQVTDTDNNSYIHGPKSTSDSETKNYGRDVLATNNTFDQGAQSNSSENKTSAFNSSTYAPKDMKDDSFGARRDTTYINETRDARQDSTTGSHTENTYTDSESKSHTRGSHSDGTSDTNIYGEHTNRHVIDEDVLKTITRKGNIGVYSASKLLGEHQELWQSFNFYKFIFDEIANEFLRIEYF